MTIKDFIFGSVFKWIIIIMLFGLGVFILSVFYGCAPSMIKGEIPACYMDRYCRHYNKKEPTACVDYSKICKNFLIRKYCLDKNNRDNSTDESFERCCLQLRQM